MKKICCLLVLATAALGGLPAADFEKHFFDPPDSARPWVFWFWINGNVSKEGIRADLEDMKRVGIGGALLFDGSMYLPPGPMRYGSDAWHEHLQHAIAVADELGLQIAVMNCAGWATAGGPWNSLEQSMKMFVWSEQSVLGGKRWQGRLPQPPTRENFYRDVAVLAVREPEFPAYSAESISPAVTVLTFPEAAECDTLILPGTEMEALCSGKIESSDDGKNYRPTALFEESAKKWPMPVAVRFPLTKARHFRVTLLKNPGAVKAADVKLGRGSRLTSLAQKTGVRPGVPAEGHEGEGRAAGEVLDLTKNLQPDGSLTWDAPPGDWTLLRFGYTTTAETNHPAVPEGTGWEVDKFDAAAVEHHFGNGLGRILREAGPHLGRSLTGVVSDSWEAGPQTWTAAMPKLFEERRGYPMGIHLACLAGRVVGSVAESEAFLRDFRKTLGDLYAEKYFGTMARLAHEHGLLLMAEGYGGVLDEYKVNAALDVPAVEFWNHNLYKSCGIVPSVAHTLGKPIVVAEAFTSRPPDQCRWTETPFSLKALGDQAFAIGVNRFALHSYVHQPRSDIAPGFTHGRYGTQFGRLNSWWPLAGGWIDYLKRCQYLLQQGSPMADLLYLDPERLQSEGRDLNFPWPKGYKGDFLSVSQLAHAKVENGLLRMNGETAYRALILPEKCHVSLDALKRLTKLRAEGAKILGSCTFLPAGLQDLNNPEWQALNASWPKGGPVEIDFPPDFLSDRDLLFAHRAGEDFDLYFISNPSSDNIEIDAGFRVTGRCPELWDPVTGRISEAPSYAIEKTHTLVHLSLEPKGSVFVVFRRTATETARSAAAQTPIEIVDIKGPWQVAFQPRRGAPEAIELKSLESLSRHHDPGVRHFSGLATYTKEIVVPEGAREVRLDLGAAHDLAEVRINGRSAGILWKPPYVVDVSGLLQPGKATLAITVANRWINRLIGDETLPPDAEYLTGGEVEDYGGRNPGALKKFPVWWNDPDQIKKRQRTTFATWKHYEGTEPLVNSGLVGPVRLLISK